MPNRFRLIRNRATPFATQNVFREVDLERVMSPCIDSHLIMSHDADELGYPFDYLRILLHVEDVQERTHFGKISLFVQIAEIYY